MRQSWSTSPSKPLTSTYPGKFSQKEIHHCYELHHCERHLCDAMTMNLNLSVSSAWLDTWIQGPSVWRLRRCKETYQVLYSLLKWFRDSISWAQIPLCSWMYIEFEFEFGVEIKLIGDGNRVEIWAWMPSQHCSNEGSKPSNLLDWRTATPEISVLCIGWTCCLPVHLLTWS